MPWLHYAGGRCTVTLGLSSSVTDSLHNNIHPLQVEIKPLKMVWGCPCDGVIDDGHAHDPLSPCEMHLSAYSCRWCPECSAGECSKSLLAWNIDCFRLRQQGPSSHETPVSLVHGGILGGSLGFRAVSVIWLRVAMYGKDAVGLGRKRARRGLSLLFFCIVSNFNNWKTDTFSACWVSLVFR